MKLAPWLSPIFVSLCILESSELFLISFRDISGKVREEEVHNGANALPRMSIDALLLAHNKRRKNTVHSRFFPHQRSLKLGVYVNVKVREQPTSNHMRRPTIYMRQAVVRGAD